MVYPMPTLRVLHAEEPWVRLLEMGNMPAWQLSQRKIWPRWPLKTGVKGIEFYGTPKQFEPARRFLGGGKAE